MTPVAFAGAWKQATIITDYFNTLFGIDKFKKRDSKIIDNFYQILFSSCTIWEDSNNNNFINSIEYNLKI